MVYRVCSSSGPGTGFFTATEGYIGLAPSTIKARDHICVLLGCRTPIVLQPDGPYSYKVVGKCYMHGMMDGAAFLGPMPSDWGHVMRYYPRAYQV